MERTQIHIRNLVANWIGHVSNVAVMFFLSPFVVHSLGDVAYGAWSLLITVAGYLGLVDIGVRVSTGRYVNFYLGRGDTESVNRVVNTSLAFYSLISLIALVAAGIVGISFGRIFPRIPPDLAVTAFPILVLLAMSVWLGLVTSVFQQLLHANERFDVRNACELVVLSLRSGLTVWVLWAGYGLVALALVQVVSGAFGCAVACLTARRFGAKVQTGWRYVKRSTFVDLFRFGTWAFIANVSLRTVYYAAIAITGLLLGAAEITYYSFGFMLIDYGRTFVALMPQQVLKPATEKAAGAGAMNELRWYFLLGSRTIMFFAVPLLVGYIVLGKEFLLLWLKKPEFAQSATVLLLLAVSQFWAIPSEAAKAVLQGIGFVPRTAMVVIGEAVVNVALSVLFVLHFRMGLVGVALGTVIPMIVFEGLILPAVACASIQYRIRDYAVKIAGRWIAGTIVLLLPAWLVAQIPWAGTWTSFATKAALVALAYAPIGWFVVLGPEQRSGVALGRRLTAVFGLARSA